MTIRHVKQAFKNSPRNTSRGTDIEFSSLAGHATALRYIQAGRFISAVKHIEILNPELSREQAKRIVNSTGYENDFKWPEEMNLPLRCL